jgi:hypothetical protein
LLIAESLLIAKEQISWQIWDAPEKFGMHKKTKKPGVFKKLRNPVFSKNLVSESTN